MKRFNDWAAERPSVNAFMLTITFVIVRMGDWYLHRNDPNDRPTVVFYATLPVVWLVAYLVARTRLRRRATRP